MIRRTRRIFFYSAMALFVFLAPLLISYSLGYTFDFTKRAVEKTGGIFIKSKTPRMSVFLNGTLVKETSYLSGEALLTDISPGIHRLRMEKANFHPWAKTVIVQPSLVTDLRNILLIPSDPSIATTTPEELADLRSFAVSKSLRLTAPKETMTDANAPPPPASPSFFLNGNHDLMKKTATTTTLFIAHINSFDVLDDNVFFIDKNGFLGKIDASSKKITTIGRPGFYLSDEQALFIKAPNGEIVITDASGGLYISDGSSNIWTITGGVRELSFDSAGKKMLIRKDQSIDLLWLADNIYQPFEKTGTLQQIFSSSSDIQDAAWFFGDDAHVVIRTFDGLFFTDIDSRDGKNIVQIFSKKTDELLTVPQIPASIFFRRGKTFYTISL